MWKEHVRRQAGERAARQVGKRDKKLMKRDKLRKEEGSGGKANIKERRNRTWWKSESRKDVRKMRVKMERDKGWYERREKRGRSERKWISKECKK